MQGSLESRIELIRALQLLGLLYSTNERGRRKVQLSEFYNATLSETMNFQDEYVRWRRAMVSFQTLNMTFPENSRASRAR